jgi:hypothetical protein
MRRHCLDLPTDLSDNSRSRIRWTQHADRMHQFLDRNGRVVDLSLRDQIVQRLRQTILYLIDIDAAIEQEPPPANQARVDERKRIVAAPASFARPRFVRWCLCHGDRLTFNKIEYAATVPISSAPWCAGERHAFDHVGIERALRQMEANKSWGVKAKRIAPTIRDWRNTLRYSALRTTDLRTYGYNGRTKLKMKLE